MLRRKSDSVEKENDHVNVEIDKDKYNQKETKSVVCLFKNCYLRIENLTTQKQKKKS